MESVECDDPPAGMQQDHGQAGERRHHEEVLRLVVEPHRPRSEAVGENINQAEGAGHHSKPEADN